MYKMTVDKAEPFKITQKKILLFLWKSCPIRALFGKYFWQCFCRNRSVKPEDDRQKNEEIIFECVLIIVEK